MRIQFHIRFLDAQVKKRIFPANYRLAIFTFLKESIRLGNPGLKERLWGTGNRVKPFTFSTYLPGVKQEQNRLLFTSDSFNLTFTFGLYDCQGISGLEIFNAFYNGMMMQGKNQAFGLDFSACGGEAYAIYTQRAYMQQEHSFRSTSEPVQFKTYSPILMRKMQPGSQPEWILPDDPAYNEWLDKSVTALCRQLNITKKNSVLLRPGKIKPVRINPYRQVAAGFTGTFAIENANHEILQALYTTGLGARTCQGFGMLGVV